MEKDKYKLQTSAYGEIGNQRLKRHINKHLLYSVSIQLLMSNQLSLKFSSFFSISHAIIQILFTYFCFGYYIDE